MASRGWFYHYSASRTSLKECDIWQHQILIICTCILGPIPSTKCCETTKGVHTLPTKPGNGLGTVMEVCTYRTGSGHTKCAVAQGGLPYMNIAGHLNL